MIGNPEHSLLESRGNWSEIHGPVYLPIDVEVWTLGFEFARRARGKGLTIPATDLVIAACARRHGAGLEHSDEHFTAIERVEA